MVGVLTHSHKFYAFVQVSDDALGHLADSCPRLRRLALWGCTQVKKGWEQMDYKTSVYPPTRVSACSLQHHRPHPYILCKKGDGPLPPGPPPAGDAGGGGPRGVGQPRLAAQGPGLGVDDGGRLRDGSLKACVCICGFGWGVVNGLGGVCLEGGGKEMGASEGCLHRGSWAGFGTEREGGQGWDGRVLGRESSPRCILGEHE